MIKVHIKITKDGAAAGEPPVYDRMADTLLLVSLERMACEAALKREGSIVEAAKLLGITRHALKRRMIKHNIRWVPEAVAQVIGEGQAS